MDTFKILRIDKYKDNDKNKLLIRNNTEYIEIEISRYNKLLKLRL